MILSLVAKFLLRGKIVQRIKTAVAQVEAEAEVVSEQLKAEIRRVIAEAKAKL